MWVKKLIFILIFSTCYSAHANIDASIMSCRTSSITELARKHESYQDLRTQGNVLKSQELNEDTVCKFDFQDLKRTSLRKVEELKSNKEFQEIVTRLQSQIPHSLESKELKSLEARNFETNITEASHNEASLFIFVSFSMGEKALLNLAQEAKRFNVTLVLRGLKDGSYLKTAKALQKIILETSQGVVIDPELYSLFHVTAVPTFVLAKPFQIQSQERTQTPIHDKLQGHVSIQYALEGFTKEGDLKEEAQTLLMEGLKK